jgi:hypothetical protein
MSIFGLMFGPKLLINAETLASWVANWLPKFHGIYLEMKKPKVGLCRTQIKNKPRYVLGELFFIFTIVGVTFFN